MKRVLTLTFLVCAALGAFGASRAAAQTMPDADPHIGDGRVSDFYRWSGPIPATPGKVLRSEPLPGELGLDGAGTQTRILYVSTDGIGGVKPTTVSGAIFVPKGAPPKGGWPLIAWAHGTVGVADICAPSWFGRSYRDVEYLQTWLAQGYAIVASDYQGLGTPGIHPYLNARAEAYGVLDSVRAARSSVPGLSDAVVVVGQSQGAQAAFATAGFAPQYAPELNVRGTVATGVPYLESKVPSSADPTKTNPGIAYVFYYVLGVEPLDPDVVPADVFSAKALPLYGLARTACIYALEGDVTLAGLSLANSFKPAIYKVLAKHLKEDSYPTLALKQPVFIGTGSADTDVEPAEQAALVKNACAAGTVVEAHVYKGLDHSQTVNASLRDSLPFVRKLFAGEKIAPRCTPTTDKEEDRSLQ